MIGQPSSPGICVSELRFGAVKPTAGEATCCIDMEMAPGVGRIAIPFCPLPAKAGRCHAAKLRRSLRHADRGCARLGKTSGRNDMIRGILAALLLVACASMAQAQTSPTVTSLGPDYPKIVIF